MLMEILTAVLITIATGACGLFWAQARRYKKLLEKESSEKIEIKIEDKLQPILEEIEELRKHLIRAEQKENDDIGLIISSYRYRLTQLCKLYIHQGYITESQFEQLSEFYKLYTSLGGNGQAKQYYEMAIKLNMVRDDD